MSTGLRQIRREAWLAGMSAAVKAPLRTKPGMSVRLARLLAWLHPAEARS